MKNLGGQDIRSEKQEKGSRWKGSIHESAPSPLGHPTPNRSPGVPAYSLEVVSAKKKKKMYLALFLLLSPAVSHRAAAGGISPDILHSLK